MTLSETVQNDATQSGSSVSRFRAIFPKVAKPLIAMAHVPALPGTPSYDPLQGVGGLVRHVQDEVELLVEAGFDAIMLSTPSVETPIPKERVGYEKVVLRCGIYPREIEHRQKKRNSYRSV